MAAAGTRSITIRFLGSTSGLRTSLGSASKDLQRFSDQAGGSASKLAGRLKVAAGALAGLGAAGALKGFLQGARESAKVTRMTENVIRSTGGAAGVTADQVGALAAAISRKTGADDEAIQSGQNLLLTFTNIRNGVGAGNQVFDQASAAITDMAAALNNGEVTTSGLKSSAIQLGKALNDPVKGVTALSKVGVSFTQGQRDQIKKLVETGDVLDAQRIILGELSTEFGGAAAASSDAFDKLHKTLGDIGEDIGGLLLGPVAKLATLLDTKAIPKIRDLIESISEGEEPFGSLQRGLEAIGTAVRDDVLPVLDRFGDRVKNAAPGLADLAGSLAPALAPLAVTLALAVDAAGLLLEGLGKVGEFFGEHSATVGAFAAALGVFAVAVIGVTVAQAAWAAVTGGLVTAFWLLNAAMSANPIGLVVVLVAALAAAFVVAWKKSETFRNIVIGTWNKILTGTGAAVKGIVTVLGWLVDKWLWAFQKIAEGMSHVPIIGGTFEGAAKAIQGVRDGVSAMVDDINANIDRITDTFTIEIKLKFTDSIDPDKVGQRTAQVNEAQADKMWQRAPENIAAANKAKAKDAGEEAGKKLADTLSAGLASGLGTGTGATKAKEKAKAVRKTGQEVLDAFLSGLSSRFPAVDDALRAWSDKLPVKLGHGLDKVVAAAEKNLTRLGKAIEVNATRLDKANDKLADAKDTLRDYAADVRGAVNALGDLGTHGGATFEIVRDRLGQTLRNAKDFAATMRRLAAAGLSDKALQQLVAAGPGVATQTGKAILAGGKTGIAQINRMQTELDRVAKATGAKLADEFFAHGVRQAEGVLAGLKSKQKVLEAQMRAAGKVLADAVLAGLHLKVTKTGTVARRAAGGPVSAGRSYLVGERGAEWFVPRQAGRIVPGAASAGAGDTHVHLTALLEIDGRVLEVPVRKIVRERDRATRARVLAGARR